MNIPYYVGRMTHDAVPDRTDSAAQLTVLVVEDNRVNQLVVTRQLQKLGFQSDVAATGTEALELLRPDHGYALVLMDWQLPDIDGLETTRRYRAVEAERGSRVPIIAITASAMPEDRVACSEAGMDGFLAKPVSLEELGEAIREVLPSVGGPADSDAAAASTADQTVLAGLISELGDTEIVVSLVRRYLTELGNREQRLALALSEGDFDVLHRIGHTLRSTSEMLGATDLAAACHKLVQVTDGDLAAAVVAEIISAAKRSRAELTEWVEAHDQTDRENL